MEVAMTNANPVLSTPATSAPMRPATPPLAARLRLAGLTLIAVYPFITALLLVVFPLTEGWPLWGRTLVVAPVMVAAMMFGIMPFLQKRFGRFVATGRLG
jgi:antibiotic biosynthesis monooxygenase (ABM) superfamily enzyme